MDLVTIDAATRTARAEAGARWPRVTEAAAKHQLGTLSGSSPLVGVVGYTLSGGQGPVLARSKRYAADHVTHVEVVSADGELRQVTQAESPTCSGRCGVARATSAG